MAHSQCENTGQGSVREPTWLAALPLSPADQASATEAGQVDWPSLRWTIEWPAGAAAPGRGVLDVYGALLAAWETAGCPPDGQVESTRYALLTGMRWESRSRNDLGQRIQKPSGRHYQQLEAALEALTRTRYRIAGPPAGQLTLEIERTGGEAMSVLSRWEMPDTGGEALRVLLSPDWIRLLQADGPMARWRPSVLAALPPLGPARPLYRALSAFPPGRSEMPLRQLFASIGASANRAVPSHFHERLGPAFGALQDAGLVDGPPHCERNGEWIVQFRTPSQALSQPLSELLVATAISFGVVPNTARYLERERPARLARTIAALLTGRMVPRRSLAGMLVAWTQGDWSFDEGGNGGHVPIDWEENPRAAYLRFLSAERRTRLQVRSDVRVDEIETQVRERLAASGAKDQPLWLVRGISLAATDRALLVPSYREFEAMLVGPARRVG